MKQTKRVVTLVLAIMMVATILVMPAAAATTWRAEISNFKPVSEYYAKLYPAYLWALQRFLFCYPTTAGDMQGSTHDGLWGSHTKAAVLTFQRSKALSADAIVGKDTWTAVATTLRSTDEGWNGTSHDCVRISSTGSPVFMVTKNCSAFYYFYGDVPGGRFHP